MFNPNHQHYVEFRTQDLQRDADQQRLVHTATQAAQRANPVMRRLMVTVGQQMVESGRALLARGEDERAETTDWEYIGHVLS